MADYPLRFINSVVNEFQKGEECGDENFIIPPSLFEIIRTKIFLKYSKNCFDSSSVNDGEFINYLTDVNMILINLKLSSQILPKKHLYQHKILRKNQQYQYNFWKHAMV